MLPVPFLVFWQVSEPLQRSLWHDQLLRSHSHGNIVAGSFRQGFVLHGLRSLLFILLRKRCLVLCPPPHVSVQLVQDDQPVSKNLIQSKKSTSTYLSDMISPVCKLIRSELFHWDKNIRLPSFWSHTWVSNHTVQQLRIHFDTQTKSFQA